MVETIHQAPEECHRTVRAANSAAPCRPIRCLDVFHSIDSVGSQQWKKELKRRNDVLIELAPIIDDDIEPAIFGRQSCQCRRVRLITLPDLDAVLAQAALIV
jgi:hypothetical protein